MRYTTILDLRDWPIIYKNQNARLLYLHLVLMSGYHDYNRDLANISIRRLADQVGITVSAARHALAQLEGVKILQRTPSGWYVRKYLKEQPISKREAKRIGAIQVPEETADPRPKKSSVQMLKDAAAAGDERAKEILKKRFNTE